MVAWYLGSAVGPILGGAAFVWVVGGLLGVVLMARHGHEPFEWAVLFLVLGPLSWPLAIAARRRDPQPVHAEPPDRNGDEQTGRLDVLVGVDGSLSADAALERAAELLGPSVTSWTLATVLDAEAPVTIAGHDLEEFATANLERASRCLRGVETRVSTVLLYGEPSAALAEYAEAEGFELLVVGTSQRGGANVLRGSVARRLAVHAPVPVLVGPARSEHVPVGLVSIGAQS